MNKKYTYRGAVYVSGKLVTDSWEASTWAVSKARAVTNLKHRFRKRAGLVVHIPVVFSGTIVAA